ncbi:glycerol kinase GlpK [Methylobacter sp.]|uniref:glycerol kinase GlpK n=1 Tax=Methylobacter sp. TaxID=2051955 RepID=UPI002489DACE|nr:glycerol kinase GlpK [Methylobacter sp.]MDI1279656.1 glycerol kinase GlpK [Methylobacter sp.]MDI1360351.1 glycerol kinase GlpK [Methylobacter sp.]
MRYILAIDQGTSSSRCVLYDRQANPVAMAQQVFTQHFPYPGWVEHDAEEIWVSQSGVVQQVMQDAQLQPDDIAGIGITNQRETTVIWERSSGKPIYNAIVWQDRRTAEDCIRLKQAGSEAMVKAKTGLLLDAYFSATKISWLLDHVEGARAKAERGELAFGTIDSWLVWKLTCGELHITDVSNAARTLLFNIDTMQWDDELLALFDIPASLLPAVKSSSEIYGQTRNREIGAGIPIAAIAGDQQAGLFGQLCINAGMAKCTYGTGSFLMMNTGAQRVASCHGLLTTIAWQIGDQIHYALEGGVFVGGAVIQWLRDGLGLFEQAADSERLAGSVDDNGGVYFVPALTGLGAPHWDPHARGAIFGITRGTTSAHLTRAALESICFQVDEVLQLLSAESGTPIVQLRIDGGASANNMLAQFQADISAVEVVRPANLETTALGAAYLAGIATGLWTIDELNQKWRIDRSFHETMPPLEVELLKRHWLKAVERAKDWAE